MNKRILSVIGLVGLGLLLVWGSAAYAQSRWSAPDGSVRGTMDNYWHAQSTDSGRMGGRMMHGGMMHGGMMHGGMMHGEMMGKGMPHMDGRGG